MIIQMLESSFAEKLFLVQLMHVASTVMTLVFFIRFAIMILAVENYEDFRFSYIVDTEVVWSADTLVSSNSTLELTAEGDLVLKNQDGLLLWSTGTSGRSVARLSLTEMGNLVLLDANNSVVWQSFDHPTDCLLPGQILKSGMDLTSHAFYTESIMGYSVSMTEEGLSASVSSYPLPQVYYQNLTFVKKRNKEASYAKFQNGSLDLYITKVEPMSPDISITFTKATSIQYMKLGQDGHLRVFERVRNEVADVFRDVLGDECGYPVVCGEYGICSNDQCSCPSATSFRPIYDRGFVNGCSQVIPLNCNAIRSHTFLDMDNITYFAFTPDIVATDMKSCKEACLKNCSCAAAIFRGAECYMPSQIFSLWQKNSVDSTTYSVSIKVQIAHFTRSHKNKTNGTALRPVVGPTANISTLWINNDNSFSADRRPTSSVKIILRRVITSDQEYACGFFCNGTCDSTLFAIFTRESDTQNPSYLAVWSANPNNPVGINSTLELTGEGDLVLRDRDGTLTWSTHTARRSVSLLNLTEMGNLVLSDSKNSVVWQSFDHPTDFLLPGQILKAGMNLTENSGLYSVSMTEKGLVASIHSDPPQVYYQHLPFLQKQNKEASYAKFQNGRLDLYITKVEPMSPDVSVFDLKATIPKYMKLGHDGHLRVFDWDKNEVADIFRDYLGDRCGYPMVCGKYGICSTGQCSCPSATSFRPINDRRLEDGCSEVVPLMCNASENHGFMDMGNVTYFAFTPDIVATDMKSCKEACLKNCSCKAAIFNGGECYMPSQVFSFMEYNTDDPTTILSIKVQIAHSTESDPNGTVLKTVLGSTLGVLLVVGTAFFVYRRRGRSEEVEEDYLDHVPGMPTRFSFEELENATDNFNKKLGEGGFGSVYEGSLNDGTRIAVKRLDGVGHIKKSFLAEVQSIGSIHHINLVRLIGFCAEKSHRLLVYAYMCNGSLERWIYCRSHEIMIEWSCRRNIILDIAKGLAYLHEDCLQKIIHLDIKPQNILLDERFNAKLGDFGLSKLIDRDQSNIVTTMRGTPGYLAPEWLKSGITEKVDVFSFGVVILEIVSGRKIFEQTRPEEERHLSTHFMEKAEEGLWLDLVDKCCLDVDSNVGEVEEMMQIAAWCLQGAPEKRPSMSVVVKILEGAKNVPEDMDYNFLISQTLEVSSKDATPLLPSLLSGPR